MQSVTYGGFWLRFIAFIIDSVIVTFLIALLLVIFYDHTALTTEDPAILWSPTYLLLNYLLPTVAVIALWHFKSATPGKMLLSLQIVDADTLQKPSLKQSTIRFFAYFISTIPLCLGFLWIAFDSRKQGWHDKIAHTLVIKRRS